MIVTSVYQTDVIKTLQCQHMMSEDLDGIVEGAVRGVKSEFSEEKRKLIESNDISNHLVDFKLDFEVGILFENLHIIVMHRRFSSI